jgi:Uma2 family endonuclease
VTDKNVQGAPNLIIEVLSKNTAEADRTTKLKLYARSGVGEYWIINPKGPSAVIYLRQEAGLDLISELGPGDSPASSLFPDFNLPLRTLLE